MRSIDRKLGGINETMRKATATEGKGLKAIEAYDILKFPAHLQPTAMALLELGHSTATQIASKTNRKRSIESLYLNELVQLGYAQKVRKGKIVHFSTAK